MTGDRVSDWIYIGGEFAGGSWAVEKDSPNGKTTRKLEYYDYRALVGFERKVLDFATFSCEVGYIFGRKFSTPDFDRDYKPDGTPFVQLKIVY